jgi:hypothetical protein
MSWVIVINSCFDSPETYYGKKVVHVQLISYPMCTGGLLPGGIAQPGRDADHSPLSSAEVKNE